MLKYLLLTLVFGLVWSCSKQELPSFTSEITQTEKDIKQQQACMGFRPYDNQLSYQGTLKLFECNKWNDGFPELYAAVKSIDEATWNFVMKPVDDQFFNSLEGRKKLFSLLKGLDQKGGIADTGKAGSLFFKTPILSLIAKHPEAWEKITKILKLSPEKRNVIFSFARAMVNTIQKAEPKLKTKLYPVFKLEKIGPYKDWFYDFLAQRYKDNNLNTDLNVLGELFKDRKSVV